MRILAVAAVLTVLAGCSRERYVVAERSEAGVYKVRADAENLCFYAKEGDLDMVRKLLRAGANPNEVVPPLNESALHAAARGSPAIVELLLAEGADPNIKEGMNGQTSLHLAASMGHVEIVSLLLREGADPNSVDNDGATPLRLAIRDYGKVDVVRLLLENGAWASAGDLEAAEAKLYWTENGLYVDLQHPEIRTMPEAELQPYREMVRCIRAARDGAFPNAQPER